MKDYQMVTSASNCIIFKLDKKLVLCRQPHGWMVIASYVFLLLAVVFLGFGIFQIVDFMLSESKYLSFGLTFTAIGAICLFFVLLISKQRSKIKSLPPEKLTCICIINLQSRLLQDCEGKRLASLDDVKLKKIFQMTSSEPALVFSWKNNMLIIAKGSPFSGGIQPLIHTLENYGVRS